MWVVCMVADTILGTDAVRRPAPTAVLQIYDKKKMQMKCTYLTIAHHLESELSHQLYQKQDEHR
jgi:hypothetical protein